MLDAEKTSASSTNGNTEHSPEQQRKLLELLQTLIGRKLGTVAE